MAWPFDEAMLVLLVLGFAALAFGPFGKALAFAFAFAVAFAFAKPAFGAISGHRAQNRLQKIRLSQSASIGASFGHCKNSKV